MGFAFCSSNFHLPKPCFWTKRSNIYDVDKKKSHIQYTPVSVFRKLKCKSMASDSNSGKNWTSLGRTLMTSFAERLSSVKQGWLFTNKVSKFIIQVLTFIASILIFIRDMALYIYYSFRPDSPYSAEGYANALNKINRYRENQLRSITTTLIKETIPNAVKFDQLRLDSACRSCTVCLHEFGSEDKVRKLSNCGHVFHEICLDGWVKQKQNTCPLCRVDLVPEGFKEEFDRRMAAATDALDAYISARFFTVSS